MYQFTGWSPYAVKISGKNYSRDGFADLSNLTEKASVNMGGGNDTVIGTAYDDHLRDYRGDDYLDGGDGNDMIEGGQGNDTLTGGQGYDAFFFGGDDIADGDLNVITDFSWSEDALVFNDLYGAARTHILSLEQLLSLEGSQLDVENTAEGLLVTYSSVTGHQEQVLMQGVYDGSAPSTGTDPGSGVDIDDGSGSGSGSGIDSGSGGGSGSGVDSGSGSGSGSGVDSGSGIDSGSGGGSGSGSVDTFIFGGTAITDGDFTSISDFSWAEDSLTVLDLHGAAQTDVTSLQQLLSLRGNQLDVIGTTEGVLITYSNTLGSTEQILLAHPPSPTAGTVAAAPPTKIVMTYGQSLAVGTTLFPTPEFLSPTPSYPDQAFELGFTQTSVSRQNASTFTGFVPMTEAQRESVGTSMINRLIYEHEAAGLDSPDFIHANAAVGGRSVLDLMTRSEDIFDSIAEGLAAKQTGDHFVVALADGRHSHYIDEGSSAYLTSTSRAGSSDAYLDRLDLFLELTVAEAQAEGRTLDTELVINWIQGQGDTNTAKTKYGYDHHVAIMIDRIEEIAVDHLGDQATVLASVSQHRGYGAKDVAIQSLAVSEDNMGAIFGAPEYVFQAAYPSAVDADYTHLSPEGYYMFGQTLGDRLFDAMTGNENTPILMESLAFLSGTELEVTLSGADGGLVDDPSFYRAENGFTAPSFFGFEVYSSSGYRNSNAPDLIDARITGDDTVVLTFDEDFSKGDYRLYLGRNNEDLIQANGFNTTQGNWFGGSTLRSAEIDVAMAPAGGQTLSDGTIYEFAPIQYVDLIVTDLSF